MTQAHINAILPIKNRVLAADENTAFLAHYDLNEHDVLRGIESIGESKVAVFDTTYFKPTGGQYSISDKLTMTAWVYPTAAPTGDRGAIVIGKPSGGYYMTLNTTYNLSVYWHGKTPAGYHDSTGACPLNQWSHIAVVWSSTELKLYINGVLDKTIAATGGGVIPTAIDIGSENGTNRHFKGKISNLGIWAQEKSNEDIKNIMNKGTSGNESGLRAFWKMNEGEGAILRDASAFHQDITHEPNKTFSWSTGNSVFTLRPREGYFGGGAIAIEEGTTNIPVSGVAGMNDIAYTYVGEEDGYKKYSISGTWNAGTYPYSFNLGSVNYTAGLSYSVSCHLYTNVPQKFADSGGYGSFGVINMVNDGAMTGAVRGIRSGNYTAREDYIHSVNMSNPAYVISQPISNGTVFDPLTDFMYIKNVQVEQKSFATSFVNGTRVTGKLEYPAKEIIDLEEGTFHCWFKPSSGFFSTSSWNRIVGHSTAGNTNEIELMRSSASNKVAFAISNSSGTPATGWNAVESTTNLVANTWYNITCTWSKTAGETKLFINGVLEDSLSGILPSAFPSVLGTIGVGYHQNYGRTMNGMIDELRVDKIARTDEEIMAWYQSNSPFWPRGIYRKSY